MNLDSGSGIKLAHILLALFLILCLVLAFFGVKELWHLVEASKYD